LRFYPSPELLRRTSDADKRRRLARGCVSDRSREAMNAPFHAPSAHFLEVILGRPQKRRTRILFRRLQPSMASKSGAAAATLSLSCRPTSSRGPTSPVCSNPFSYCFELAIAKATLGGSVGSSKNQLLWKMAPKSDGICPLPSSSTLVDGRNSFFWRFMLEIDVSATDEGAKFRVSSHIVTLALSMKHVEHRKKAL